MTDIKEILALVSQSPRADAPMAKAALERIMELEGAIAAVLKHRVGDLPSRGWLIDTDNSRTDLARLAAIAAQSKEQG
jgi:hypothetical protein